MKRLFLVLIIIAFLMGCHYHNPDNPPPGTIYEEDITPPPAPAHAYKTYWYYPDVHVYFDAATLIYFFFDDGHWRHSRRFPYGHRGGHVRLRHGGHNKPWKYHGYYRNKHPGKGRYNHPRYKGGPYKYKGRKGRR